MEKEIEVENMRAAFSQKLDILKKTSKVASCIDGGCSDGFRLRKETMELQALITEQLKRK